MDELDQDDRKSLFLKITGNPLEHPGSQEGLRCARGFAADGRWRVTVEICAESVECFNTSSDQLQGFDLTSLGDLSRRVHFIVAPSDGSSKNASPDWVNPVTPDEALLLGQVADVILVF